MALWDELPADLRDSGVLDPLRDALGAIDTAGLTRHEMTDVDGAWSVRSVDVDIAELVGLSVDSATGRFGGGGSSTSIEFVSTEVTVAYGRHLAGPGGAEDGGWHLDLDVPGVRLLIPYLRGAKLDARGQLISDPSNEQVRFILPRLVIRTMQLAGDRVRTRLRSASTSGSSVDGIYSAIRMTPGHALVGPGHTVGFAFRTAELDLSTLNDPPGLPAGARAVAGQWQGLHLPEVRLFLAPDGLEGLAVAAGVKDLWIGIGEQEGVTGTFSAEVVNRGGQPDVRARFVTPGGRHVAAVRDAAVEVPDQSLFVVDAEGGRAPHTITVSVDGATPVEADRVHLTVPTTGSTLLVVTVADADDHVGLPISFQAVRPSATEGAPPDLINPARLRVLTPERGRMSIVRQSATDVTVRLEPEASATWAWPGGSATGTEATVPLGPGDTLALTARPDALRPMVMDCWFAFDHPQPSETTQAWWQNPVHTSSAPGLSGASFTETARSRRSDIGAIPLVVDGYASYEGDDSESKRTYNHQLSARRRDAALAILTDLDYTVSAGTAHGHEAARDGTPLDAGTPAPSPRSSHWWLARARSTTPNSVDIEAELLRDPAPANPSTDQYDPRPPTRGTPDCFRRLGIEVELIRTTFVRLEIWGEFDIQTAVETGLDEGQEAPLGGRRPNPGDGLCMFRVRLRIASDRASWEMFGEFRALETDLDGLWARRLSDPNINTDTLNALGALAVLGPLASQAADLSPAVGTLVQLGSLVLGATDVVETKVLTLHGAELVVSDGIIAPDGSTDADRGPQVSVLLDVEVEFVFDLGVIHVPEDRPVRTRYKAVGVRFEWGAGARTEYVPVPVFDPSRGYELDIQPGSLVAVSPLDEILRIFGVRVSRDNPTYLEVEAGIGVPLGPITVDTLRVRARLDAFELPQLTKLGASLDIPGTVHGTGALELTEAGFKAAFDLTLIPLNIRAAAVLAVETKGGVTAVLIGSEVQFPVPLLLGSSGLGIYGFLGGVGINYTRLEDATARIPALDWLMKQLGAGRQNVMHPDGWTHSAGSYAIAAGMLLGTAEGGFVLHLKGIVIIEVPGPRLLLVMKADVLKLPPALQSTQSATFLAMLDLDFGAGTITLGIVADYTIERILRIHVPVTAFFDKNEPENWLVELGTYHDRVTVEVLDVFSGTGYLMVHGDGIEIPPLPRATGLAIATGFHIQAVLMGSKAARLYVEVAAGFDAVLGFDPFFLAGKIYVRGELMLFIVSIGVSAELTLMVGKRIEDGVVRDDPYVKGEVCGRVNFFFFTVKGCVKLEIGHEPDPDPLPRDLVAGLTLVGRSPALVEGTGSRVSDGAIGEASEIVDGAVEGEVPVVPLDAVPVIRFHVAPNAEGLTVMGSSPTNTNGVNGNRAWRRIGERWWAYRIASVTLSGPLTPGPTPSVWWSQNPPGSSTTEAPALALLDWLPTAFTTTVPYGQALREQTEHRWGTVCRRAAPPQAQLWTFVHQPVGSSPDGWLLNPILWPNPDEQPRTTSAGRRLRVTEPWRTGDPSADAHQGTDPAEVIGDAVGCATYTTDPSNPLRAWTQDNGPLNPTTWAGDRAASWHDVVELLTAGATLHDVAGAWHDQSADPDFVRLSGCEGRILSSPLHTFDESAPLGTEADRRLVGVARDAASWVPWTLANAVHMTTGEELAEFSVLLLVPYSEGAHPLVAEVRAANGVVLDLSTISWANNVDSTNPLPDRWVDRGGPWAEPIELAGRLAAKFSRPGTEWTGLNLITWNDLPEGASTIVIGQLQGRADPPSMRRFSVIAASGLTRAELRRHDWDETVIDRDRSALETALTQEPSDHALLEPGHDYDLTVTWTSDSEAGDEMPTRSPTFTNPQTQAFRFATEAASQVPDDLGPWLLDTNPDMGEAGVFCREPLRVTFATQNVLRLFDAYGHRLEVTVRAASGHHPQPPGGGPAGTALILPVQAEDAPAPLQVKENRVVLSPWEQMTSEVIADQPCVNIDHVSRNVEEFVLAYDLEPLTDYILDIEAVPHTGNGRKRIYRVNFTTSRFDDLDHIASWIAPAAVEHRLVRDTVPLDTLPARPTGREWDDAMQKAGLPVPQVPSAPRVEVLWTDDLDPDSKPQPVAVVVESSEQLVRDRVMPVQVTGPADALDPSHTWWAARPKEWLTVQVTSPAPDPALAATSRTPIVGPGGTRVLVPLAPGQRGKRLALDLVQEPDLLASDPARSVTIVDVTLTGAPWEVEF